MTAKALFKNNLTILRWASNCAKLGVHEAKETGERETGAPVHVFGVPSPS